VQTAEYLQFGKIAFHVAIIRHWNKIGVIPAEVAIGNGIVIRLQATSFSSFSYDQQRNTLDAGRPTPDLKLLG